MLADSGGLVIDIDVSANPIVLRLTGELDADNADSLTAEGQTLIAGGYRHLTINCADLRFCDSFGLRAMTVLWDSVQPDGSVTIAFASDHLRRLFQITGLADMLGVSDNPQEPGSQPTD